MIIMITMIIRKIIIIIIITALHCSVVYAPWPSIISIIIMISGWRSRIMAECWHIPPYNHLLCHPCIHCHEGSRHCHHHHHHHHWQLHKNTLRHYLLHEGCHHHHHHQNKNTVIIDDIFQESPVYLLKTKGEALESLQSYRTVNTDKER